MIFLFDMVVVFLVGLFWQTLLSLSSCKLILTSTLGLLVFLYLRFARPALELMLLG